MKGFRLLTGSSATQPVSPELAREPVKGRFAQERDLSEPEGAWYKLDTSVPLQSNGLPERRLPFPTEQISFIGLPI